MKDLTVRKIWKDQASYIDQEIEISGWIKTVRASKKFGFIELSDGTFFKTIQIVFEENLSNFKEISKFTLGTSITVKGKLVETAGAKQPFEVKASEIVLEGLCEFCYP